MEFLIGFLAALVVVWVLRSAARRRSYLAACEYWVYLPGETLPPQDEVMTRMLRDTPGAPIGPKEGRLFSDVRLHAALILRSKNPHVFRPDLFGEEVEPSKDLLTRLAEARSLAKVRFVSEQPLTDRLHLRFIPAMAGAMAHLGGGLVLFDAVCEKLLPAEELNAAIEGGADLEGADWQTRVLWRSTTDGGRAETRGLVKVGLREIVTNDAPADHQVLVTQVLEEVVRRLWTEGAFPPEMSVVCYDDEFKITFLKDSPGPVKVRIQRVSG